MSTSPQAADPSRATRAELAVRAAESVAAVGALARSVGKAASSPALHSTVTAFTEYEQTIEQTNAMLLKVSQGLHDVEEVVDELAEALSGPSSAPQQ